MRRNAIDDREKILLAMEQVSPDGISAADWEKVFMGAQAAGVSYSEFDAWASKDPRPGKYTPQRNLTRWGSCDPSKGRQAGSALDVFKNHGFKIPTKRRHNHPDDMKLYDWNDEIGGGNADDMWNPDPADIMKAPPEEGWNDSGSFDEIIQYLNLLYKQDDLIGLNPKSQYNEDEKKWEPYGIERPTRTVKEWIQELEKYRSKNDVCYSFGDYEKKAGMWIYINPLDGKGFMKANVVDFRYCLIECDVIPMAEQIKRYKRMRLPIAAMVNSGGKSIHAVVKIEAKDMNQYIQRVDFLFDYCTKNGLPIDGANKNCNRLTRLPGIWRNGKKQYLISGECGCGSWDEWEKMHEADDMPELVNIYDALQKPHEPAPVLIEGTLRQGHKMIISSASKSGKSIWLIELAAAISTGTKWAGTGKLCNKGRVLYINMEIAENSFTTRVESVLKEKNLDLDHADPIDVWNLRGKNFDIAKIAKWLAKIGTGVYIAIIVDPIYKVLTGDENSATDMADFTRYFDEIADCTGASVIYVHHHSKGSQVNKSSIDRASGSGVFTRDADAIVDVIKLDEDEEEDEGRIPYKVETTLREFRSWTCRMYYEYPQHIYDESGALTHRGEEMPIKKTNERKKEEKEVKKNKCFALLERIVGTNTIAEVNVDEIGKLFYGDREPYGEGQRKTIRSYMKELEVAGKIVRRADNTGSYVRLKDPDENKPEPEQQKIPTEPEEVSDPEQEQAPPKQATPKPPEPEKKPRKRKKGGNTTVATTTTQKDG